MELIINSELSQRIEDIDFSGSPAADSELVKAILLLAHPVGSYYWSSDATNPHDIFGGTWTQIKDKFIIAVGDSHTAGTSYGSNTKDISHTHGVPGVAHKHSTGNHTLTYDEMPSHKHALAFGPTTSGGNPGWPYGIDSSAGTNSAGGKGWSGNLGTFEEGGGSAHSHGDTGNTTPSATTTNSQSTTSLDITPACIAAYCWRRTA